MWKWGKLCKLEFKVICIFKILIFIEFLGIFFYEKRGVFVGGVGVGVCAYVCVCSYKEM